MGTLNKKEAAASPPEATPSNEMSEDMSDTSSIHQNSVVVNTIPEAMRSERRWVLWRYVERDGKQTKLPFQPSGGYAKSSNPDTWNALEDVLGVADEFDGIGFVLGGGWLGVDLDHVVDGGVLRPAARDIVDQLASYTEYSPSGEGVHIIARGKLPGDKRRTTHDGVDIEMYDGGRYFTVTGDRFAEPHLWGVEERTQEVADLHAEVFAGKGVAEVGEVAVVSPPLSNIEVIEKCYAAANSNKFISLYEDANLSEYDGDHSVADFSLCSLFAFFTQDVDQIDQLFRQSALMRPKWNRDDYAERTIIKAIVGKESYWGEELSFNVVDKAVDLPDEPFTYADIGKIVDETTWAWHGWIPNGSLWTVFGSKGHGKSMLMLELMRVFTEGGTFPDGQEYEGPTGRVLFIETESMEGEWATRMRARGVDPSKIMTLGTHEEPFPLVDLTKPSVFNLLVQMIEKYTPVTVMIDSLTGAHSTDENDAKMFAPLKALAGIARDYNIPIGITHYTNKRSVDSRLTLQHMRGSSAIGQVFRSMLAVDETKDNKRRLYHVAGNFAKSPEPLEFVIEDTTVVFKPLQDDARNEWSQKRGALLEVLCERGQMNQGDTVVVAQDWYRAEYGGDVPGRDAFRNMLDTLVDRGEVIIDIGERGAHMYRARDNFAAIFKDTKDE